MLRIGLKSGLVASQFAYLSAAHLGPDPVEGRTKLPSSAQRESERRHRRVYHRSQAANARRYGNRHRQNLYAGQPGLPPDEVGRGAADSVPGRPPRAGNHASPVANNNLHTVGIVQPSNPNR